MNTFSIPYIADIGYPSFDITLTKGSYLLRIPHRFMYLLGLYGSYRILKWCMSTIRYGINCTLKCERKALVQNETGVEVWAVVMGASEPIGREFAKELADRKFSLVLMGESLSSLDKLSQELIQKGTKVITLPVTVYSDGDFSKFQTSVKNTLQALEVRILINAERVMTHRDTFHESKVEEIAAQMNAHIIAPTVLTHTCLMHFLTQGSGGAILNLSSGLASGVNPLYRKPLYGATRSFVDYLSQGLYRDYSEKGIYIHTIRQMLTSESSEQELNTFVRNCLSWVGRQPVIHGGFVHALKSSLYGKLV